MSETGGDHTAATLLSMEAVSSATPEIMPGHALVEFSSQEVLKVAMTTPLLF